ncbi:MAG: AAC(3) family N-acetyltransferase [Acidobacteriia bacterium]|nr:AAC(3) family N-acetyltransferase [Terriglobia bacterium]
MHSREQLANDLRRLEVGSGDTGMVHASVRAVGEVAGAPDEIHLALKDVLTAEGTLMRYASCARYYDEVGRGSLTKDQSVTVAKSHTLKTPSRPGVNECNRLFTSTIALPPFA